MTKYSIILRAYNAETFLRKSVESVQQQSYPHWELIIVNDGSSDDTGIIADQFAREDTRITVVHQENKGRLLASRVGMEASTGAYVVELDADDWYEADYLEKVDAAVRRFDPDIVAVNHNVVNDSEIIERVRVIEREGLITCSEAVVQFLEKTNSSLWNKVIRREKIEYSSEYLDFLNKKGRATDFGDDLYLLMPVLCQCNRIYLLESFLYNYYVNMDSITHQRVQASWKDLHQRIDLMETTYRTIQQNGLMTEKVESLIQRNSVQFSLPVIIQLVKKCKLDRKEISKLKANTFYKNIVATIPCANLKELTNLKIMTAFRCFNLLVKIAPNRSKSIGK